jgi:cytochrome P450
MRTVRDLPGPNGLPLLGNLFELDLKRLHRQLEGWANQFGSIYVFEITRKPVVVFTDPEHIQTILRNRPKVYRRLGSIEPVFKEMGINGVFSAEGEDWKRQRRLTSHAFDSKHLQEFFPTLLKVTERLRNRWSKAVKSDAPIDVQQDFMRYTVDVTTNLAFGYEMNTLDTEGDIIQEHLEKIFPAINRRVNAPFPWWRYFKLPQDRALDKALAAIRESIDRFIAEARTRLEKNPELAAHPTNLLEAMLTARDDGNAAFSDDEIHGNALTMLLGGEDTTANTLAWMTHYMSELPNVQNAMHSEARAVVCETGMLVNLEDAERLPYIEAVTHETMRLKPVAPVLFLETIEEVEVGGVTLPKQTALMTLMMHGAVQDVNFGHAAEFDPKRWLENQGKGGAESRSNSGGACLHNTRAFVPFGGGPRVCPGRHLALVEIKVAMSMICSAFEIVKPPNASEPKEVFSFSMMPEGLRAVIKKR